MGENTSLFAFICDKPAALPMTDVPEPGGAKWGRKQLEAGVHLCCLCTHLHPSLEGPAWPQVMLNHCRWDGFRTHGLILA